MAATLLLLILRSSFYTLLHAVLCSRSLRVSLFLSHSFSLSSSWGYAKKKIAYNRRFSLSHPDVFRAGLPEMSGEINCPRSISFFIYTCFFFSFSSSVLYRYHNDSPRLTKTLERNKQKTKTRSGERIHGFKIENLTESLLCVL